MTKGIKPLTLNYKKTEKRREQVEEPHPPQLTRGGWNQDPSQFKMVEVDSIGNEMNRYGMVDSGAMEGVMANFSQFVGNLTLFLMNPRMDNFFLALTYDSGENLANLRKDVEAVPYEYRGQLDTWFSRIDYLIHEKNGPGGRTSKRFIQFYERSLQSRGDQGGYFWIDIFDNYSGSSHTCTVYSDSRHCEKNGMHTKGKVQVVLDYKNPDGGITNCAFSYQVDPEYYEKESNPFYHWRFNEYTNMGTHEVEYGAELYRVRINWVTGFGVMVNQGCCIM